VRRHWFDPIDKRWEFGELPTTDEEAKSFLRGCSDAKPDLEHTLLRVGSALSRGVGGEEAGPRGPPEP